MIGKILGTVAILGIGLLIYSEYKKAIKNNNVSIKK